MSDDLPPAPTPPAESGTPNAVTNISGGVNINAQGDVYISGDIVGRDKITYTVIPRDKNLSIVLEKVKTFWVEDVLENSVHHAALIDLDKQVQAEAVEVDHPWETVVRAADKPDRRLPSGHEIVDVFNETEGALLILGEPGSGKTTTLLELVRDLIVRAETDSTLPVPVVFNLSSWAEKRRTITEWLIDELKTKYGVPSRMGRQWVENNDLILLLDGLDEVKSEHRKACAAAINEFRVEYGLTRMVVCSRTREYEELASQLKLNSAALIQPLTSGQIDRYIAAGGPHLAALGNAIRTDVVLRELAQAPLMLSIMSLAYAGQSVDSLTSVLHDLAQRRKHLFDAYVDKMFARTARTAYEPYSRVDTVHWLTWLAERMSEYGQTVFLIEGMQPSWLQSNSQRRMFSIGFGLVGGLLFGLPWALLAGWAFGLLGALIGWLLFGLIFVLTFRPKDIIQAESLKWSRSNLRAYLTDRKSNLFFIYREVGEPISALGIGLILALCSGLGVFMGVWAGIGPGAGLGFGLAVGLFFVLVGGLSVAQSETKTKPNQGIWLAGRNAVLVMLVAALFFGPILGLIFGPAIGSDVGSSVGLWLVLTLGLYIGLVVGGFAFIQHFVLRFILWRNDYSPRKYVRFLDYAADRIFLRKVGGGYIFIHRMLMEYFASLETPPSAESGK